MLFVINVAGVFLYILTALQYSIQLCTTAFCTHAVLTGVYLTQTHIHNDCTHTHLTKLLIKQI